MKKYNHLYFTEQSREMANMKNSTFWTYISDLENANPNTKIIITESLENKWGQLYSILNFECSNPDLLEKIQSIYTNHWYPIPLELYPEFSHLTLDEILED